MAQKDYNIKEIVQLEACTNCCLCAEVCPAVSATENGQLSGVYRLAELRSIMRSRSWLFRRFFAKKQPTQAQLKQFSETVYRCTLCGRCQETCPSGIMLRDLWFSLRQDLVHSEAYPKKVDMIRENVALNSYISYAQDILFLFQAIFMEKSVKYLQTTTIDHVSFYRPNSVPQLVRRLFYAER